MLDHYRMFADYNRWANRQLYQAAAALSDVRTIAKTGAPSSVRCMLDAQPPSGRGFRIPG